MKREVLKLKEENAFIIYHGMKKISEFDSEYNVCF
jgi:hypothetical protein